MLFDDNSAESFAAGYESTFMIKKGTLYAIGNNAV
jgi:hypothetical protein